MCFIEVPLPIDWQRASEVMKLRGKSLREYPLFQEVVDEYLKSEQNLAMKEYSEKMNRLKGKTIGDLWYKDKLEYFLTIVEWDRGSYTVVVPLFLTKMVDWHKEPLYKLWVQKVTEHLDAVMPKEVTNNN